MMIEFVVLFTIVIPIEVISATYCHDEITSMKSP